MRRGGACAAFYLAAQTLQFVVTRGFAPAGVAPLAAFSGPLYFPATATVMALLLAWLVRQAAAARASLKGAAR